MALDRQNWMSHLASDVRVIDTYISASHDASAYKSGVQGSSLWNDIMGSICQSANYYYQLSAGSRYFDMRVTFNDAGTLIMKHSFLKFDLFENVLYEIKQFGRRHPGEFIFLDLDWDSGDGRFTPAVLAALIKILGEGSENPFATAHVGEKGEYNTDLTWGDLRKQGKQFIVIWQAGVDSGKAWAPSAEKIRDNFEDDFNHKSPSEIIQYLTESLQNWPKQKLFVTQLINTPGFSPIHPPEEEDRKAAPVFNPWVTSHQPGSNLGIVKRDFVTSSWNQQAIEYLIKMNRFTTTPGINLGSMINYQDMIRLKTESGLYLYVDLSSPMWFLGGIGAIGLTKVPNENSQFRLRSYHYHPSTQWEASGNLDADSNGAHGSFRLVHLTGNGGEEKVLSCFRNNGEGLYWGVGWGPADDYETWLPYDMTGYATNTGPIYDGSKILIRSIWHMYWKEDKDTIRVTAGSEADATIFTVERA